MKDRNNRIYNVLRDGTTGILKIPYVEVVELHGYNWEDCKVKRLYKDEFNSKGFTEVYKSKRK